MSTVNPWVASLPADKVEVWLEKNLAKVREAFYLDQNSDPHFALWLYYTDRVCRRRTFMGLLDLEDWDYWSAYDGGSTPMAAVTDMLGDNHPGRYGWDVE